jgi:predicted CxxxxCH...CXXCH cytochrome family protein
MSPTARSSGEDVTPVSPKPNACRNTACHSNPPATSPSKEREEAGVKVPPFTSGRSGLLGAGAGAGRCLAAANDTGVHTRAHTL